MAALKARGRVIRMAQIQQATPDAIRTAAEMLGSGQLVAFPTETVYGLGAAARNAEAVGKIYDLKGRPRGHPLIVHLPDASHVNVWASDVPYVVNELTEQFWPGPLTLVLTRSVAVPSEVTGGQQTVALRMPAHPTAMQLLKVFGDGVAAPSANLFGHVSPTTAQHVAADFPGPLLVLDGGPCTVGLESTILDVSQLAHGQPARLLRPGGVPVSRLEDVLGSKVLLPGQWGAAAPRVPGSLQSHYAAKAPARLVKAEELRSLTRSGRLSSDIGVMAFGPRPPGHAGQWLQMHDEPERYARHLYACLRQIDATQPREILIEEVPPGTAWDAVRDRLKRATS